MIYTGQLKKKVTLSHVYNEVTSEPTITRFTAIVRKALKVLVCYLTNTQYGNPVSHAHVNPIVHFCPDSLQHVPVYGCHSGDDALSQFLKIIWQGWYIDDVLDLPQPLHSCYRVGHRKMQDTERLLLWSRHFATRSPLAVAARNNFPRQLQTNFESFPNNCISRDC
jgi:hypothetical protein